MSAIVDAFLFRSLVKYRNGRPTLDLSGAQKVPPHPAPPAKHVRLTHTVGQNDIRVTYPDGQSEMFYHNPDIVRVLAARGLPEEKIERVIDYLWNFYVVYVDCGETDPAPPNLPNEFLPE